MSRSFFSQHSIWLNKLDNGNDPMSEYVLISKHCFEYLSPKMIFELKKKYREVLEMYYKHVDSNY